jgi:hypothetical protein
MNFIIKILSGEGEHYPSSKRFITLVAFLLIVVAFIAELFFNKTVSPQTLENIMYIVIGGLGFTASEKFTKKTGNKDE